jgi:hypothetical protein
LPFSATIWRRNGLISATRGKIVIRDREALIALAEASYGAPEAEDERLISDNPLRSKAVGSRQQ